MKYNEKYDRWVSREGIVYRYNKTKDKLEICNVEIHKGYIKCFTKIGRRYVHRIVYETFKGEIPSGYEIDHINANRSDNKLENLKCVTHKENMNNPITKKTIGRISSKVNKSNTNVKGKTWSEFGKKFKEHYGITKYKDISLYRKERYYWNKNGKCRWEDK